MAKTSISEIRKELSFLEKKELEELCLKLAKFKLENKDLLSYLLFDSNDEESFIERVKEELSAEFKGINKTHYYYIKKSVRKILRLTKKYIRYSKQKETEIEILMHFLLCLRKMQPDFTRNSVLRGIYDRELLHVKTCISVLHEDLQLDYSEATQSLSL